MDIRILSFNIHKGRSPYLRRLVLDGIRDVMRALGPDIVFLQEVSGGSEKQFEFLADQFWHHYAYGRNAVYASGDHGNVIMSKFPIVQWANTDLSTNPFERRGLLNAVIEIPGKAAGLHVACTHLDLLERNRMKQLARIVHVLKAVCPTDEPAVLAGDFNDWTGRVSAMLAKHAGMDEIATLLGLPPLKTFPSLLPVLPLDRILVQGMAVRDVSVVRSTGRSGLSDHLPVVATVTLP
ncbi:MAG: endonuclease/exonuclease/phosphatase family protein [Gammaproteobacteria bacterium]|nr:endonuclease/exonuclease/phosphatase family protein [Gammaproteobacteria bacterium]